MPLVISTSLNAGNGPHAEILKANGFKYRHVPADADIYGSEDALISELDGVEAVIAGSEPYTPKVLAAAPQLRAICRSGVGFDAIDLNACDEAGIVVTTTPGVNHHAVAEHTIALLMGVARGFPDLDQRVRTGRWNRITRPRVMGSTLGLVGLGRIGRAVATRAVGLGMNVLAFEPFPVKEFIEQWRIELTDLDDLLSRSDFVSLHCPMSAENHHLMNTERIGKMKHGSVLINTARGLLIDEAALNDALKSGQLRAAGLDVFEEEPLSTDSPLIELSNIFLSGHVAGLDNESHHGTFTMCAEIIIDLYNGGWPAECVQNLRGVSDWKWSRA